MIPSNSRRRRVSAVVITLNAATQLEACLHGLSFADEIVVVDCGSTDRTIEMATARNARVIRQVWLGYGRQKDFAVSQAVNDWVLCVDADEIVSPELRNSIEAVLNAPVAGACGRGRLRCLAGGLRRSGSPGRCNWMFLGSSRNWAGHRLSPCSGV